MDCLWFILLSYCAGVFAGVLISSSKKESNKDADLDNTGCECEAWCICECSCGKYVGECTCNELEQ